MKKYALSFLFIWLINLLVLYFSVLIYSNYLVFGSIYIPAGVAVFTASFTWTLIVWLAKPLVNFFIKIKGQLVMVIFYLTANFVALWLTARLAPVTGFGTVKFVWLIPSVVAADIIQYLVWNLAKLGKK
jgi:hypothetical protein